MPVLWLAGFFTVLVCFSITSITLWQLRQTRAHELEIANTNAANLSRSMAQQADDTFDQADIPVAGIVERLSYDGFGAATSSRMHEYLRATADQRRADPGPVHLRQGRQLGGHLAQSHAGRRQ
ncbi:MAG: hypothetical protein PW896_17260 [Pseudomonas sp.]|uniref:hypothetical protein n=1 Tax=Pseudomonas sp. TaxID=306 RepID=UPI002382ADB6|nr:hypothetical protein [Pseudomonas sp.]MDE1196878.1 hypothetical protein [Pseudomonas sp.]